MSRANVSLEGLYALSVAIFLVVWAVGSYRGYAKIWRAQERAARMRRLGVKVAAVGAAMVTLGASTRSAARAFVEFEQAMNRVKAMIDPTAKPPHT